MLVTGLPGAPGVAIGPVWRFRPASTGVAPDRSATRPPPARCSSRRRAAAASQLEALAARVRERGADDEAQILEAQALMASDPGLLDEAVRLAVAGSPPLEALRAAAEGFAATLAASTIRCSPHGPPMSSTSRAASREWCWAPRSRGRSAGDRRRRRPAAVGHGRAANRNAPGDRARGRARRSPTRRSSPVASGSRRSSPRGPAGRGRSAPSTSLAVASSSSMATAERSSSRRRRPSGARLRSVPRPCRNDEHAR